MKRAEQLKLYDNMRKQALINHYYGREFMEYTTGQLEMLDERFRDFAKSHGLKGRVPNPAKVWQSALGRYAVKGSKEAGFVGVIGNTDNVFSRRIYKKEETLTLDDVHRMIIAETTKAQKAQKKVANLNRTLGRLEAKYGSKQTVLAGAF